ncbi:class A beta-lactamase-related serine hydrolase (plasmid) [Deinococcus taeanensis]|uniref:serine hydrolase n=1 Tax=Deinococcus taeanensis TaxID=2737050 RepID=UPI001CDBCB23|nr:serine hydrolase [Deinococcus taeanensis]UBV44909.1 class A beta-lactamase-related serine hydrolase [Deinococcus taeanensis]
MRTLAFWTGLISICLLTGLGHAAAASVTPTSSDAALTCAALPSSAVTLPQGAALSPVPPLPITPANQTPVAPDSVPPAPAPLTPPPLPSMVSGRVSFFAAIYDDSGQPVRTITLGNPDAVHPLASTFKPLVVRAILGDVDGGRFKLTSPFTTTVANRSIEGYPQGTNPLQDLVRRAIYESDNTAADILHLAYGPARLAREVNSRSPCTKVLLTTKAWWAAQSGQTPQVMPLDPRTGNVLPRAAAYAQLPFEERVAFAQRLIQESQTLNAPAMNKKLDQYFLGPSYTPDLEVYIQNTSTAWAYSDLMLRTLSGDGLQPVTRALFRTVMATGCCQPKVPKLKPAYWAAKAGSGWRLMTMTGYVEMPDGYNMAYTYLNDRSTTTYAGNMEKQMRPVLGWIEQNLLILRWRP